MRGTARRAWSLPAAQGTWLPRALAVAASGATLARQKNLAVLTIPALTGGARRTRTPRACVGTPFTELSADVDLSAYADDLHEARHAPPPHPRAAPSVPDHVIVQPAHDARFSVSHVEVRSPVVSRIEFQDIAAPHGLPAAAASSNAWCAPLQAESFCICVSSGPAHSQPPL